MAALEWSSDFVLDLPQMDDTHQEFVELLADVESASDGGVIAAWKELVEHTDTHFSREDRWMVETRFAATNCHSTQHQIILQIMQRGAEEGQNGNLEMVRQMAKELAVWFPQHAHSMDAALAGHLHRVGYDTVTGAILKPQALPVSEIHGCAGESCSDTETSPQSMEATA